MRMRGTRCIMRFCTRSTLRILHSSERCWCFAAPQGVVIDGALLLISMLMLSPMTSRSHYVVLMLPYTAIVALSARDRLTPSLGWLVLLASFILATATSNDVVGQEVTEWSYGHSFLVWGALVLVAYLAVVVWRRYRAERPRAISC